MNRKTLILLVALIAIVGIYFLLNRNIANTLTGSDRDFDFKSTAKIDKVFISSRATKKYVTLTKQADSGWLVNDQFKVNPVQIDLLFSTLRKMRVKRPVSRHEKNTVVKDMTLNATKVEIYESGKVSKVFYVGQNTQDEMGTYFYMENGKEPYVCHIPGQNAYLNSRFFTDVVAWRSKNIFNTKEEQIKTIELQWTEPGKSFIINNEQKEPVLISENRTYQNNTEANLNKIRSYLKLWENLSFEGFPIDLDAHDIDSISRTQPLLIISLTDKNNKVTRLTIHKKGIKEDSNIKFDQEGNPLQFEIENFYAFINDNKKEVVQIQDFVFGKVMKYNTDFLLK